MDSSRRIQTGLRFSPLLIMRLKQAARANHQSFNGYVEGLLDKALNANHPHLDRADFLPTDEILRLGRTIPPFTQEELDNDPKLARLLSE